MLIAISRDDRLGLGLDQDDRAAGWSAWFYCGLWVLVEVRSAEPLIDMTMMRIRGVWTTNLVAFLLGAGMYAAFLIIPQFAQLPKSTGFGFGASIVTAGLYLLPAALGMSLVGPFAGRVARRYGSRMAVIVGSAITALAFAWLAVMQATRTTC